MIVFSGLIVLAGSLEGECVRIGGQSFGGAGSSFADAFALSWTTLSTVVSWSEIECQPMLSIATFLFVLTYIYICL